MFCDKYSEWGILYLYNELETDEKKRFETHLLKCADCQTELAVLKEAKKFVHSLPQEELDPAVCTELQQPAISRFKLISVRPARFFEAFKLFIRLKWRIALVPLVLSVFILGILFINNPPFATRTSILLADNEFLLEWDSGLEDSLDSLGEKINQFTFQKEITEIVVLDEQNVLFLTESNLDDKMERIEKDIYSLSRELNNLNF